METVTCSPCINPFNLHTAMTQSGFHLSSLVNNFYVHSHLGCWFTLMKIQSFKMWGICECHDLGSLPVGPWGSMGDLARLSRMPCYCQSHCQTTFPFHQHEGLPWTTLGIKQPSMEVLKLWVCDGTQRVSETSHPSGEEGCPYPMVAVWCNKTCGLGPLM